MILHNWILQVSQASYNPPASQTITGTNKNGPWIPIDIGGVPHWALTVYFVYPNSLALNENCGETNCQMYPVYNGKNISVSSLIKNNIKNKNKNILRRNRRCGYLQFWPTPLGLYYKRNGHINLCAMKSVLYLAKVYKLNSRFCKKVLYIF
jgi:hypothetical protein